MIEYDTLRMFHKWCPHLCHDIRRKRYLTRKPHGGLYANQDDLDHDFELKIIHMILDYRQQGDTHRVENMMLFAALQYDRPVLFLEPGLGDVLYRTDIHEDCSTTDVHMPWPQFRLMLPKGLLRAPSQGGIEMGLKYIDGFMWQMGEAFAMPYKYAVELAEFSSRMGEPIQANRLAEQYTNTQSKVSGLYLVAGTDYKLPGYQPDILTTVIPWYDTDLCKMVKGSGHRLDGTRNDEAMNPALLDATRHLFYQVLLHIGAEPIYVDKEPTAWVRKPKVEGKHFKSGLVQARYVGDLRPELWTEPTHHEKAEPTGATHAPHWVRGYRRRQRYGPKSSLTKLIWIKPYKTGGWLEDAV
jgi:hypothetical protein